jgi:Outer membrane protein beta-barrel domain
MWLRSVTAFALTSGTLLVNSEALAYEGQFHLGGGVGVASFTRSDAPVALAIGAHAAYEINDMFDARLELMASEHQFVENQKTRLYSATAGLTYKLDVIALVPYAGILAGLYAFEGYYPYVNEQPERRLQPGISIPLGLDYTVSRTFALGVQLRYHGFLSDPLQSERDGPFSTALVRAEYRLGW